MFEKGGTRNRTPDLQKKESPFIYVYPSQMSSTTGQMFAHACAHMYIQTVCQHIHYAYMRTSVYGRTGVTSGTTGGGTTGIHCGQYAWRLAPVQLKHADACLQAKPCMLSSQLPIGFRHWDLRRLRFSRRCRSLALFCKVHTLLNVHPNSIYVHCVWGAELQ